MDHSVQFHVIITGRIALLSISLYRYKKQASIGTWSGDLSIPGTVRTEKSKVNYEFDTSKGKQEPRTDPFPDIIRV